MTLPESEAVRKGLLALIEKEIRFAEREIAEIRERYDLFSQEALSQAIQDGKITGHPAWEDYIIWKNKQAHIARLRQVAAHS
jgi:hypothetical protein